LQRAGDLDPYPVLRVVQPALTLVVRGVRPARSDQRNDGGARIERSIERPREVFAGFQRIDVAEDAPGAEDVRQVVGKSPGGHVTVRAPVADEDVTHADARADRPACVIA
jgi:hypothetical protein